MQLSIICIHYSISCEKGEKKKISVNRHEIKINEILTDDDPIERILQGYRRRRRYEDSKGKKGKSRGFSRGHLNIQAVENLRIEEQNARKRVEGRCHGKKETQDGLHIKWTRNEAGYVAWLVQEHMPPSSIREVCLAFLLGVHFVYIGSTCKRACKCEYTLWNVYMLGRVCTMYTG